jgi:DivIVA domain-containing protein
MAPLTPADIHNMAFKKPPIGKRGYGEEEVDALLDEAEQEMIRLLEENAALSEQVNRQGGGNNNGSQGPGQQTMAMRAELNDLIAQLERMHEARGRAEQNARSLQSQLEQARSAASAAPARSESSEQPNSAVMMMAQRTADDHMRDARQESENVLTTARDRARQLTADAQLKASTVESDARRNHADAMNSLDAERTALLEEIERLGQLAESYRAALDSHLSRQLEDLGGAGAPGEATA